MAVKKLDRAGLPPSGVSGITSTGARAPVATKSEALRMKAPPVRNLTVAEQARARAQGRLRRPGEDTLTGAALEQGRRSGSGQGPVPPGTTRIEQDVVEIPISSKKGNRGVAIWDSIDGNQYNFRFLGADGKIDKNRIYMCLFMAIRELRLGGDPLDVINAFRLKFDDDNGLQVFPIVDIEVPPIEHLFTPIADWSHGEVNIFNTAAEVDPADPPDAPFGLDDES